MSTHPTQILLHTPSALRIEFLVNTGELILWWSPRAGTSFAAADRNFSNRDDHLCVFERIAFPGLTPGEFSSCTYDPYHCVVRYPHQHLHIAPSPDMAAVLVWADYPQSVEFKTGRYDDAAMRGPSVFVARHTEPSYAFEFAAAWGAGDARFRMAPMREQWRAAYAALDLAAGQTLAIGAGIEGDDIAGRASALACADRDETLRRHAARVAAQTRAGRVEAAHAPEVTRLQDITRACLHSTIDDSGALRASIKAIYYLIWVRDAAFCFNYQAAAGWLHRHDAWCRLMMENRLELGEPGLPQGKVFGQLVSPTLGKFEEDGIYYAVWSVFTHWTQSGDDTWVSGRNLDMLKESMACIEAYIFDSKRGLFGSYFADETPACGARDQHWDYAIGKPGGPAHISYRGTPVLRSYDIYCNLLMHAAWTMLAAVSEPAAAAEYERKARDLWKRLEQFFAPGDGGLPPYGDLLLDDGSTVRCEPFGPARSVYVWALSLPIFAPVPGIDGIRRRLLEHLLRQPGGHWVNGICSVVASLDTFVCPEQLLIDAIELITSQSMTPGAYLPMGGAMPEKCDAPQGNIYHDIRPQAFAQSSWLAALANLGVRRLHHGLAVRATRYLRAISDYAWQGRSISFEFTGVNGLPLLVINGTPCAHTLQLPEETLDRTENTVSLRSGGAHPCLVRSTARLERVAADKRTVTYSMSAHGATELVFAAQPRSCDVSDASGSPIVSSHAAHDGLHFITFTARGPVTVRAGISAEGG